ncbi:fructose-6-phosphate aldolase [Enterococcus mundtii]|uniref:fructose-6-phosphate aldolase n=1 Tax=Enterococcus TaxID=1350 RepID=UPI000CF0CC15|nr:fructose-6-phosphate aldolase [Enterococcus mundtii]MDB7102242.1 fructose-6-phosphate aldolase [Enterococcus mundtii]PQC30078.1 fructose-bisphosphate aldolase [Enterococcus mundtii]
MEFMLDTINIEKISYYQSILPLSGVTSNPSIIKKEGKIDLFAHLKEIKQLIGKASLHVQVVGETTEEILADAQVIIDQLGKEIFIKVPVNEPGLAAIKQLKAEGINVTATAIYSEMQGYLAIAAGADYLAPYYNRMENLNIDAVAIIKALAMEIERTQSPSKILAASFKNVAQVNQACRQGAHSITASPDIFAQVFGMPSIQKAVTDFRKDWEETFGVKDVKALGATGAISPTK